MDHIDVLLESFRSGHADKFEVVTSLADVMDARVDSFFLQRVLDSSEEDLVRIEILKAMALRESEPTDQIVAGSAVMKILSQEDDVLVRQHAAKAMRHFIASDGAVDLLEKVALDDREDEDVRHNAAASIEANAFRPDCRLAILRLMNIPMFRTSGERAIERLSLPHE